MRLLPISTCHELCTIQPLLAVHPISTAEYIESIKALSSVQHFKQAMLKVFFFRELTC